MNSRKTPVNDSMAIGFLADMKKRLIGILFLGVGFSLFAQTNSNASIFIPPVTGIGKDQKDNAVIAQMLTNEIKSRKGTVGKSIQGADFILYGTIAPYHEEEQYYHDYVFLNTEDPSTDVTVYTYNATLRDAPWEQVYIFQLILKNQETNQAILLQNLLYLSIEDVYDYFPLLIYNIFTKINFKEGYAETEIDDWRNKWLYLRASLYFPVAFYELKNDNLPVTNGMFSNFYDIPAPLTNKTGVPVSLPFSVPLINKEAYMLLPGMTLGAEVQLLNWLSIEPNVQLGCENLDTVIYYNLTAGLELKFPIKFFRNIMLEPYGAVSQFVYTYTSAPKNKNLFKSLPSFAFGGGLQVGMKGWRDTGSVFLDINYMYYKRDIEINNLYEDLYDDPTEIHYRRSVLGLGIGYKFGVINRK